MLRPYVDRYFAVLATLWDERGGDLARGLVDALFPRALVEEATVEATDAYLATHRPAPALRRLLLEAREDVARALNAQRHGAPAG